MEKYPDYWEMVTRDITARKLLAEAMLYRGSPFTAMSSIKLTELANYM